MKSLSNFVLHGKIGEIFLGMSRRQTYELLGEPKDWLGKDTVIGKRFDSYDQSDLWFYYEGSVGVRFGNDGLAEKIIVYPRNAVICAQLFKNWPSMNDLRMGEWRTALQSNGIPFRESENKSLNYWIVAGGTCVTCCFPSPEETGTYLNGRGRLVEMLQKYLTVEAMEKDSAFVTIA